MKMVGEECTLSGHHDPKSCPACQQSERTKWIRFGEWLEAQPPEIQDAVEAIAKTYDWVD